MTELDRNVRTLIVCFSIAIFGLIPLRFVEVSQLGAEKPTVLGEYIEEEIVLPQTAESANKYEIGQLEAPYDSIDNTVLGESVECVTSDEVLSKVEEVNQAIKSNSHNRFETEEMIRNLLLMQESVCR